MIQLLMAAALAVIACARVPALVRNGSDTVFVAAVLAGSSAFLTNPAVYLAVDRFLGGMNLTRLLMQALIILGLWALRSALLQAVAPQAVPRAVFRGTPLYLALGSLVVLFILLGPTVTTVTWGDDHEAKIAGALFSVVCVSFISWMCGEIAVVCARVVPRMRGVFRPGFALVGAGCTVGSIAMVMLTLTVLSRAIPLLTPFAWHSPDGYRVLELVSVSLVGIGLTMTAVAGHRRRSAVARWEKKALAGIEPIRQHALGLAGLKRTLESDRHSTAQDRLHRMIVEIWDADLNSGTSRILTAEQRAYLLEVESKLELNHAG